jgi:hypothetical protein
LIFGLAILIAGQAWAEPWKFGVMSDTQWPNSPDGKNPNVAVNIINHINKKFIDEKVKFVIQVGDLNDKPSTVVVNPARVENLDIRATFAQALYNAGIGFYPLRGNHEDKPSNPGGTLPADFYGSYAREFQRIFPQTGAVPAYAGINNNTPHDAIVTSNAFATYYPPLLPPTTPTFNVGVNFTTEPTMEGLTYSFDYNNSRFVLIDQFTKPAGTSHSNLDATDVTWIGTQFSSRPANTHAFSFAHKGLVTENHADNMFNSTNPTASPASKDLMESFMQKLQDAGVRYHLCGHDHMHNRAIISSPNTGNFKVQNIITSSNSYKFYIPPKQSTFNSQLFRNLETPISQEIFTVGYYIFTVDGPKVTVDFYSMPNGCNGDCDQTYDVIPYEGNTPTSYIQLNGPGSTATSLVPTVVTFANPVPFTKHETFGYSLNGIEKLVPQGDSYALMDDTSKAIANGETGYVGTKAAILDGSNGSTGKDYNLRPLTKSVNTGWAPKDNDLLDSDIFTLWGMADSLATKLTPVDSSSPQYIDYTYFVPDTVKTDSYVLSMTYKPGHSEHLGNGGFGIATQDANGNWVNAVDQNLGTDSITTFVKGPWKKGYALGTYGVDASTKTAWAVINYDGSFAVANGIEPVPGHRK